MPDSVAPAAASLFESPSSLAQLALGAVLLLFGRRLFWLLIAAVGFAIGVLVADTYLTFGSEVWRWIAGLLVGVLAALAAIFLKRIAVSLGGMLIGGYSVYWYLGLGGQPLQGWHWLAVAVAALIGLFVGRIVFDFGLITLSAMAGATLVLDSVGAGPEVSRWLFLLLVVLGAVVQASSSRDKKR